MSTDMFSLEEVSAGTRIPSRVAVLRFFPRKGSASCWTVARIAGQMATRYWPPSIWVSSFEVELCTRSNHFLESESPDTHLHRALWQHISVSALITGSFV